MNIKILTVDKISDKFTKEAVKEYGKRLTKYCKLLLKECKNEIQVIKELNDRTYLIHINSAGQLISSEELADKFSELGLSGQSDVTFLISQGSLSKELQERINYEMAISKMDIGFDVLIVIIYEQIYRGYRILNNEPYHK